MDTMRDRLLVWMGLEPLIVISVMVVVASIIYKFFLKNVNQERHENLKQLFRELYLTHLLFIATWILQSAVHRGVIPLDDFFRYFGLATILFGALTLIRVIKIFVFEYLFINSMKAGVPVLLVNLVTLVFSIFIVAWLSTSILGVRWAPLLATSAFLSVVMGLALQETLGNLFAGVALQFDKPYEIGDWIEVNNPTNSAVFIGEVHEITWRATTLYGFMDEVIIVPNRLVAQAQVSNFSARRKPIYRAISIYMDTDANDERIKVILQKALKEAKGVLQHLNHYVMLRDITEKGAHWRVSYPVVSFSQQYFVVDEILMRAQAEFKKAGVQVARLRVDARNESSSPER